MKLNRLILFACILVLFSGSIAGAKVKKAKRKKAPQAQAQQIQKPVQKKTQFVTRQGNQLSQALAMVRNGNLQSGVPILFQISRNPDFESEKDQIKYILGNALLDLGLNQVAAFQFVEVIKSGNRKYLRQALEKLSVAADALGDETLLNYAISKVDVDSFPSSLRDMVSFRLGEVKLRAADFKSAAQHFNRVSASSRHFYQAKYNQALAFAEGNQAKAAVQVFEELVQLRSKASVTDNIRVLALMGLARSSYQAQDWEGSIKTYREIPKDHPAWHQALFESSWALFRGARFRSALSQFHSLHSTYYEDAYLPESLLLRGIVYLYICKYDEMEKVLSLFEKIYDPLSAQISRSVSSMDSLNIYKELESLQQSQSDDVEAPTRLSKLVLKKVYEEGDVQRGFQYIQAIQEEGRKVDSLSFARASFGNYAKRVLAHRLKNARISIGENAKIHLQNINTELKDLQEQLGFLRYEMINGTKESLKKKISGKVLPPLDDQFDRSFYVQNGYEYWPFQGEYWLDEIGNYHYLGKSSCE